MDAIWLLDKKPRTETRQLPSVRKGIAMGIFSATEGSPIRLDLRGGGDLHPWKINMEPKNDPWKSKTIKIIVPNLGWLKFTTKTIVFCEKLFF